MTYSGNSIPPTLLLVEDNPDDQRFFLWAMKRSELPITVRMAADGEQAIDFMSRNPDRLSIILSDVHLPRRSGWDVLDWVRRQPLYRRLPVLIWTSLPDPDGERRAIELGATSYLSKPDAVDGYRKLVSAIATYLRD